MGLAAPATAIVEIVAGAALIAGAELDLGLLASLVVLMATGAGRLAAV